MLARRTQVILDVQQIWQQRPRSDTNRVTTAQQQEDQDCGEEHHIRGPDLECPTDEEPAHIQHAGTEKFLEQEAADEKSAQYEEEVDATRPEVAKIRYDRLPRSGL
jgi:hypothetical protein